MSIPSSYVSNKQIYREFTNSGQAVLRDDDRYFVERQADGSWKFTEPTDRVVSTADLGKDFGLWKDREITSGHLWWKKVIRPADGKIQPDEVLPMGAVMRSQFDSEVPGSIYPNLAYHDYDRLQPLKTQLTITKDGGTLHTDWQTLYRHSENELYAESRSYLA